MVWILVVLVVRVRLPAIHHLHPFGGNGGRYGVGELGEDLAMMSVLADGILDPCGKVVAWFVLIR